MPVMALNPNRLIRDAPCSGGLGSRPYQDPRPLNPERIWLNTILPIHLFVEYLLGNTDI